MEIPHYRNTILEINPFEFDSHQRQQKKNLSVNAKMERSNIVGDIMWPIILFLKICGHSPLSYEPVTGPGCPMTGRTAIKQYKIRFGSLLFVWSATCAVWIIFVMTYSLYDGWTIMHDNLKSVNRTNVWRDAIENQGEIGAPFPKSILITIQILMALVPIIHASELVLEWAESGSLAEFLNAWAPIQKEFQSVFSSSSTLMSQWFIHLKKPRDRLIFIYVVIPAIIFVPAFFVINFSSFFLTLMIALPSAFTISAVAAMEDLRVIMTYRILAETLKQIREGMSFSRKLEKLTPNKIRAWRNLVQSVREQVQKAGESQKSHQLLLIGGSIVLITGSVFVLLHIPWNGRTSFITGLAGVGIAFLFIQMGKLYWKILAANLILQQESLIASDLVYMNTDEDDDLNIQSEIKIFHSIIIQNPSVISFGSYVSLNKGLILKVSSQVVTYLIVLMQLTD